MLLLRDYSTRLYFYEGFPKLFFYILRSPEDQIDRLRELSMADHDYLMAEVG